MPPFVCVNTKLMGLSNKYANSLIDKTLLSRFVSAFLIDFYQEFHARLCVISVSGFNFAYLFELAQNLYTQKFIRYNEHTSPYTYMDCVRVCLKR